MIGAQYWISMGVAEERVHELAAKARPQCPQCHSDGIYLDAGGEPVGCGCTKGIEQHWQSPGLNRHVRHQGVW